MRNPGYYWVKYAGWWVIGEYLKTDCDEYFWEISGIHVDDEVIQEIDEQQIVRK